MTQINGLKGPNFERNMGRTDRNARDLGIRSKREETHYIQEETYSRKGQLTEIGFGNSKRERASQVSSPGEESRRSKHGKELTSPGNSTKQAITTLAEIINEVDANRV